MKKGVIPMPAEAVLRTADLADLPKVKSVADALRRFLVPPALKDLAESVIHDLIIVAEHEGAIVGFARYDPRYTGEAFLQNLIVLPNHQGQGIGKRLLQEVIRRAQRLGCRVLIVDVPVALPSNAFFRHLGFERIGVTVKPPLKQPHTRWQLPLYPPTPDAPMPAITQRTEPLPLTSQIAALLPPQKIYVEVFGGAAAVIFTKPPFPVEVYNDYDSRLVNLFRVLRDEAKYAQLVKLSQNLVAEKDCADDVVQAWRFFVVARQHIQGRVGSIWQYAHWSTQEGLARLVQQWIGDIPLAPELHGRVMRIQIEHNTTQRIFKLYDTPETCFFCDPQNLLEPTPKPPPSEQDITDLVNLLLKVQGKALLLDTRKPAYDTLEQNNWLRLDIPNSSLSLWLNYQPPCYPLLQP